MRQFKYSCVFRRLYEMVMLVPHNSAITCRAEKDMLALETASGHIVNVTYT